LSIIRNHILRSNGIVLSWLTPIGADRPTSSTTYFWSFEPDPEDSGLRIEDIGFEAFSNI